MCCLEHCRRLRARHRHRSAALTPLSAAQSPGTPGMSSYLARVRMWLLDFDGYGGRGEDIADDDALSLCHYPRGIPGMRRRGRAG